jgi:hypothetical protein
MQQGPLGPFLFYCQCNGPRGPPLASAMITPLLSVGAFGTHLIGNSNGYSFTGTVPSDIKVGLYANEQEGIQAFVTWFKKQDADFQREHVGNLRNDVFVLFLS